ncbi:MAG: hypothetical protein KC457_35085, partial [Myxococcales bacterium]|nr:hypothetical protein [Myxococcales bacterium]
QRVIATLRVCWAGPEGFDHESRETFDIDNFTDLVDESEIAVVSRMLVDPAHRDQSLTARFALEALPQVAARGIQLVLGECEPHLVNRWARLGFRPYGLCEHPVNGTLVRIALVVAEHMPGPDSLVARRLVDRLTNSQRITSESVDADRFWAAIAETLALDEGEDQRQAVGLGDPGVLARRVEVALDVRRQALDGDLGAALNMTVDHRLGLALGEAVEAGGELLEIGTRPRQRVVADRRSIADDFGRERPSTFEVHGHEAGA